MSPERERRFTTPQWRGWRSRSDAGNIETPAETPTTPAETPTTQTPAETPTTETPAETPTTETPTTETPAETPATEYRRTLGRHRFVFECVYGLKDYGGGGHVGAILADDMGLGKTLQSITLIYTLLKCREKGGQPIAKRAVVVCPCSLVKNWQDEFEKWINCRATTKAERIECMALADTTRKTVEGMIDQFLAPTNYYDVLVVSYETFRAQSERFARKKDSADLIVCDEAHRLKNEDAQTSQALASLACGSRAKCVGPGFATAFETTSPAMPTLQDSSNAVFVSPSSVAPAGAGAASYCRARRCRTTSWSSSR